MSDRPILFSAPMVRALIAGTKTQTRRLLKNSALAAREPQWEAKKGPDGVWRLEADAPEVSGRIVPDIRIAVGDRLYVREAWRVPAQYDRVPPRDLDRQFVGYEADCGSGQISATGKLRQAMHMPRWASRITLTVTDVRVERLQDITNEDCIAEGVPVHPNTHAPRTGPVIDDFARQRGLISHYGAEYMRIWNAVNGAGAWEANPWVSAYTFDCQLGNIDQIGGRK